MIIREINETEVYKLLTCINKLSEHHNLVSVNFKGCYPSKPYENTLNSFSTSIQNGKSHIAVIEKDETVIGFCKVDIVEENGKLDYLVVLKEHRGQGFGKQLMDWAMETFRRNNITYIEVKVVDGNDAIHLYEKYGFKINSHILWYCDK